MDTQAFPSPGPAAGAAAVPRLSATVLVARDGERGMELLMVRRHGRSGFAAAAWVFPGGTIDEADCQLDPARWRGIHPPALTDRFALPADRVLGIHVAAVRETFEEAGLLLAAHAGGAPVDLADERIQAMRSALAARDAGSGAFAAWLEDERLVCELGRLSYAFRWVTPAQEPRRYDTCFFLAEAPADQIARHDRVEVTDQRWIGAADALAQNRTGRFPMVYPQIKTLEALAVHGTVTDTLAWAQGQPQVRSLLPHIVTDEAGRYVEILHPDDPRHPHERGAPDTAP